MRDMTSVKGRSARRASLLEAGKKAVKDIAKKSRLHPLRWKGVRNDRDGDRKGSGNSGRPTVRVGRRRWENEI